MPVAVSCWVAPRAKEPLAGVIAIETKGGCWITSVAAPLIEAKVALMLTLPTPVAVAKPVAVMLARDGVEEFHSTELVKFFVPPSV